MQHPQNATQKPLLFNSACYIPEELKPLVWKGRLTYTMHARNVSADSASAVRIKLPDYVEESKSVLIEAEYDPLSRQCTKQVWRQKMNEDWDLCLVVTAKGHVKTVWLNHRTDNHATLQRGRFATAFAWRKAPKPSVAH